MSTCISMMNPVSMSHARDRGAWVLLPIGTTEVNGPHLPLGYDYLVSEALAKAVCDQVDAVWAPTVTYGVSEALSSLTGTVWISPSALQAQVSGVLRSLLAGGFEKILLLNNHMPNQYPVEYAVRELRRETGIVIPSIFPALIARDLSGDLFGDDPSVGGHGGEPSTSLMLHLHPEAVEMDNASARQIQPFRGFDVLSPVEARFRESRVSIYLDVGDLSPTGGWGDPRSGSAEIGKQLFDRMVTFVADFVSAWDERSAG